MENKKTEISPIPEYVPTLYVNDSEPDIDEEHLNKTERALKRVTDAANEAIVALKELNTLKIDTAKIVNNFLSTDPETVLSGAMGKLLDERLTSLNGEVKQNSFNLENKPAEQTDLNAIYSGVHRYSNLSKNIPSAHNGYIIAIKRTVSTYGQIALDDSGTLYSRVCVDSSWGNWK